MPKYEPCTKPDVHEAVYKDVVNEYINPKKDDLLKDLNMGEM